jgi:anaerobic selenocysteine-containing dehydrogenase
LKPAPDGRRIVAVEERTIYRTCPLCEATCGLELTMTNGTLLRVRGDDDDVFSHGFICPKGTTIGALQDDPDRLRTPMVRGEDGALHPATWEEAFAEIARRLPPIIEAHGPNAVGVYLGNPSVHNLSGILYGRVLLKALRTRNIFSASTVDQRPKELSSALMFGTMSSFAVPDLDRTSYLLILGANPLESNGSLATAPDWPGRLKRIRERGGRVVVIDPKRTRTADIASEHVPIRPGTDALLLMAIVHTLFDEGLVDLGPAGEYVTGVEEVEAVARAFSPEAVAAATRIDAQTTRRLARELAAAPAAAVYGRIGTCTQEFGTLASWLVDVVNVLTGNLDRPGGAMFAKPAAGGANTAGAPRYGREVRIGRHHSRVRNLPETFGELPVSCLAEEIETPGEGQIRALITIAGNPAVSTPNSGRLQKAIDGLEFQLAVDFYVNETTRTADVILPPPGPLSRSHYDLAFYLFSLRNVANYSPPAVPLAEGEMHEWRILCTVAAIAQGAPPDVDPAFVDELTIRTLIDRSLADEHSPIHGRDADDVLADLEPRVGPERVLDFLLRVGPYRLTLDEVEKHEHGLDLGELEPRLPEVLRTASGMVELAPEPCLTDVERLRGALDRARDDDGFVLIGRRHLRSNNSWMHNIGTLVKGKDRCTLQIHPDDAARIGVTEGGSAKVESRAGHLVAPVELTDAVFPGVVSLPHGWGHDLPGVEMEIARENAGVNSNLLADEELYDVLSGNAVLNGIPVRVLPA